MAVHHRQSYCQTCRRQTMHVRSSPDVPHILHLVVTIFLCGLWLPVWIIHAILRGSGEPWRCNGCGSARGWFGSVSRGGIVALDVKPAGPSLRQKSQSDKCPQCGNAMMPGMEMGDLIYNCPGCGQVFERAIR